MVSAPAEPVGECPRHECAPHGPQGHPAGDDLEEERADVEVLLDAVERPGDDALVVAEEDAGQHDHDAHGHQGPWSSGRRRGRPALAGWGPGGVRIRAVRTPGPVRGHPWPSPDGSGGGAARTRDPGGPANDRPGRRNLEAC